MTRNEISDYVRINKEYKDYNHGQNDGFKNKLCMSTPTFTQFPNIVLFNKLLSVQPLSTEKDINFQLRKSRKSYYAGLKYSCFQ